MPVVKSLIDLPTTAAIVECRQKEFQNLLQQPDPDLISIYLDIKFNGRGGDAGDYVVFARNASLQTRQNAVRDLLNSILASREPGVTLNNANISIVGLPV